jgi:tRNA threonylcarbamoyladenosine biosynthesis protein TsaE
VRVKKASRKTKSSRKRSAAAGSTTRLGARLPQAALAPAREHLLRSPAATLALGRKLGALLEPGDFISLHGDLGAGKTLFVRGAALGAGVPEEEQATSPTFALAHVYRGGRVLLQHLDLYRLAGAADLFALGFDDLLAEPAATLCEWPERAGAALPQERLEVHLEHRGERTRGVRLVARGARAEALARTLLPTDLPGKK